MDTPNTYRVPTSQWKKWDEVQRQIFNYIYDYMSMNQNLFKHPKAVIDTPYKWNTTAWNVAFIAANDLKEFYGEA